MFKRTAAMFLTLCMLFSLVPAPVVYAQDIVPDDETPISDGDLPGDPEPEPEPEPEPCEHSGGSANCSALAICENCGEGYGSYGSHSFVEGLCEFCGEAEPQPEPEPEPESCEHSGGSANCSALAICESCGEGYGSYGSHSFVEGLCEFCGEVEPQPEPEILYIGEWSWADPDNMLEDGELALPGTSVDFVALFEDIIALLPAAISTEYGELSIAWSCGSYPAEGAYQGEYVFSATLPEGYELSAEAAALTVPVILGGAAMYETYTGSCGTNVTWSFDSDTGVLTISGSGAMNDYDIYNLPNYIDEHNIKSVIVSSGVTHIGNYAFGAKNQQITDVSISDTVVSIGDNAFSGCTVLSTLKLPNSLQSIGDSAFYECRVSSITFPNTLNSIGTAAFARCPNLKSVTLPSSLTSIGDRAFAYCNALTSISIPANITSIGEEAFAYCGELDDISFSHGSSDTLNIGNNAFAGYTSYTLATTVKVPNANNMHSAISSYNWADSHRTVTYESTQPDGPIDGTFNGSSAQVDAQGNLLINEVNFPDDTFRAYISTKFDPYNHGYLTPSEVAAVTEIDIEGNTNEKGLKGLEYFTELQTLKCARMGLSSLDVSKNTKLSNLDCAQNKLKSLDLSQNTALISLNCTENELYTLDLSKNTALTTLHAIQSYSTEAYRNGQFYCVDLKTIIGDDNIARIVDTKESGISTYSQGYDKTTGIYTLGNRSKEFTYYYNTQAPLSGYYLEVKVSVSLPVNMYDSYFPDEIFRNYISTNFDRNNDSALSPSEIAAVKNINCANMEITNLKGIEYFTELETLDCSGNKLTTLDLSENTKLTTLNCAGQTASANAAWEEGKCIVDMAAVVDNNIAKVSAVSGEKYSYVSASGKMTLSEPPAVGGELTLKYNYLTSRGGSAPAGDDGFMTVTLTVTVPEKPVTAVTLEGIEITTPPTKTVYGIGEKFDPSGMVVTAKYSDGSSKAVEGYTLSPDAELKEEDSKIIVSYTEGNITKSVDVDITVEWRLYINEENFPDANFKAYVDTLPHTNEGYFTKDEVLAVKEIRCNNKQIADMKGIEHFTEITLIDCGRNSFTSLDLSKNTKLVKLICQFSALETNKLQSLTLGNQSSLEKISLYETALTSLDLSNTPALKELEISHGSITALDISKCPALQKLTCDDNQLTSLDLSNNPELKSLSLDNNMLSNLDLSNNTKLTSLSCDDNQLTSLDVSKLSALTRLYCNNNQLTSLDVSKLSALTSLYCNNNQLTSLRIDNCNALNQIQCENNSIASLDLSATTSLTSLKCGNNRLPMLELKNNTALTNKYPGADVGNHIIYLEAEERSGAYIVDMKSLVGEENISRVKLTYGGTLDTETGIVTINAADESASSVMLVYSFDTANEVAPVLDVRAAVTLNQPAEYVEINEINFPDPVFRQFVADNFDNDSDNKLSRAEIEAVTEIDCRYNWSNSTNPTYTGIRDLSGIGFFSNLLSLDCSYNFKLESLDLRQNVLLREVSCLGGDVVSRERGILTTIDVRGLALLETLVCDYHPIEYLDLSTNTSLNYLSCRYTKLTELDISACPLKYLYCYASKLSSLTVGNFDKTVTIDCGDNRFAMLDLSEKNVDAQSAYFRDQKIDITAKYGEDGYYVDMADVVGKDYIGWVCDITGGEYDESSASGRLILDVADGASKHTVTYNFRIKGADQPACVMSVTATVEIPPVYSVSVTNGEGDGKYMENDVVSIKADAPETGKMFSTWSGADEFSFTVGGKTSPEASFTMPAKAVELTALYEDIVLTGISVSTQPTKTVYFEGERFDPAGMVVTASYSDGSSKEVSGFTCAPDGALTTDNSSITVSYTEGGVTMSAEVTITVNPIVLTGISITTQPKLEYNEGEALDLSALAVKAEYNDGSSTTLSHDSSGLSLSIANGIMLSKAEHNGKTISLSFGGKSAETATLRVSSTDAGIKSVKLAGTECAISGNTLSVTLPAGTDLSKLSADDFSIETNDGGASISAPVSSDNGKTWSIDIISESGAKQSYSLSVDVAVNQDELDLAAAKELISKQDWTLAQAEGNDESSIKGWIESQLKNLDLKGAEVGEIIIDKLSPAIEGSKDDADGTAGSFSFTVKLSKGTSSDSITVSKGSIAPTDYTKPLIPDGMVELPFPYAAPGEAVPFNNEYYTVTEDSTLILPKGVGGFIVIIQTNGAADAHSSYPVGMEVFEIKYVDEKPTVVADVFDNILQYSGSSIRVTGKKGIRMITSVPEDLRSRLLSAGVDGYTLQEYGTVVGWASELGGAEPTLDMPAAKSNFAYRKGVADPIFAHSGGLIQYTNVLVNFTDEQCKPDLVMRPYIILQNSEGQNFTLYGGSVQRSIGYIAWQNRNVFTPGSAEYEYLWDIIHAVYGDEYDSEYKTK